MQPLQRALLSLEGLSTGDGMGEKFFIPEYQAITKIMNKELPATPWPYTDDSHMAFSIIETLQQHGRINQDYLAQRFAERFKEEPHRGYAGGAVRLLTAVLAGGNWKKESSALFGGKGSYGNGAAMRVAPLGAYFADDLDAAHENAILSAEVTHSHPEGISGAIAVAVGAALACQIGEGREQEAIPFLEEVVNYVPESKTKKRIGEVIGISKDTHPHQVARAVGSGEDVSAQDTIPFCLWCAANNLDNFEKAIWDTLNGLGDRDTTCAIVGGIVVLSDRKKGIPEEWLRRREMLPEGSGCGKY